ncbi:LacI family DNA-binding transcriptional regulator [Roseibium salinum]|uniref:LacI family DNA-binding transcriptional regulator n=1 Tax=Roseibium salinum TaxID=1604349 RepID=A0ABT3R911_9HYPH|nr:LacI family DNA-binding transcriptional regulator [Roseibium sp. DSM 29163]MCX2725596.1 LacI family DNA-binding transcriptional regulator [Roseibium sp. DSM 29163]
MIADRLGVSVTTVARAINGSPKTSAGMAERVNRVAEELGYVRNMEGVKLRTGRTYVLAALLKFPSDTEIGDPTLLGLLQGIHQRCRDTDYSVRTIIAPETGEDTIELERLVKGRGCDGVVLDHTSLQDRRVKYLLEAGMPFITFGRTELFSPHAFFDVDNEFAAWQGTSELIRRGHRNIALLDGPEAYTYVRQRMTGYRRALAEAGLSYREELVRNLDPQADAARLAAAELVRTTGVDGIVCVNDVVLMGARRGVRDAAPERFKNFGFSVRSGTNLGDYLETRPVTSYFSRIDAGWSLADMLIRRIEGQPVEELQKLVRTELR